MKKVARVVLKAVGLEKTARKAVSGYKRFRTVDSPRNKRLIRDYFQNYQIAKLHLGCGFHELAGWLNSDYEPQSERVANLDVTITWPIKDSSVDYIFSEHMIEHIPYLDGLHMLGECHRVLKPGGTVRIVTPDLKFLLALFGTGISDLQRAYVKWSIKRHLETEMDYDPVQVLNLFMRSWGHQFIYDEKTLHRSFQKAGFTDIRVGKLNESDDAVLRNLENTSRMPEGFLAFESMIFEGRKR